MKKWSGIQLAIAILLCGYLLSSCGNTAKLTRRYQSVHYYQYSNDSIKYDIGVNGFAFEPEGSKQPSEKNVFDLSPQGQKELIKVLGDKGSKPDDFLNRLPRTLTTQKKDPVAIADHTKFSKRLVFSVQNLSVCEADRISKVSITLRISDPNIRIVSFDKLLTKYESVDVGKTNFSNTTNLGISGNAVAGLPADTSASAAAGQPGFGYGISANASDSRTYAEEVRLKQRFVSLSGYVTPNSVNLYEESVSGIDLSGNIIADISLEYRNNNATKLVYEFNDLIKDNVYAKPDSVGISEQYILSPNLQNDIRMSFEYTGTLRHVITGDQSISESDDDILLRRGTAMGRDSITIIPKVELDAKIWEIAKGGDILQISSPLANPFGNLFFDSFEQAKQFLFWLKKSKQQVLAGTGFLSRKIYQLLVAGLPVTDDFINKCYIRLAF